MDTLLDLRESARFQKISIQHILRTYSKCKFPIVNDLLHVKPINLNISHNYLDKEGNKITRVVFVTSVQ